MNCPVQNGEGVQVLRHAPGGEIRRALIFSRPAIPRIIHRPQRWAHQHTHHLSM
jgi:hypothetical protein